MPRTTTLRFHLLSTVLFAISLLAAPVYGDLQLLGNLGGGESIAATTFTTGDAYSIGFSVGSSSVFLTSVDLVLRANSTLGAATLELRSDAGGNPEPSGIAISSRNITSTSYGPYNFASQTPIPLTANKTYWLTLSHNIPDLILVASSIGDVIPTGAFASFQGLRTGPLADQTFDPNSVIPNLFPFPPPAIQINGVTAVPEPQSLVLITMLAAPLAFNRFRSRLSRLVV